MIDHLYVRTGAWLATICWLPLARSRQSFEGDNGVPAAGRHVERTFPALGDGREADETRVSSSIRKKAFAGIDSRSRAVQRFRVDPERPQFCSKNLGSPLGFGSLFFRTCSLFLLSIELLPCLLELLLCSIAVSGELDESQESAAVGTENCKAVFGHLELDTKSRARPALDFDDVFQAGAATNPAGELDLIGVVDVILFDPDFS